MPFAFACLPHLLLGVESPRTNNTIIILLQSDVLLIIDMVAQVRSRELPRGKHVKTITLQNITFQIQHVGPDEPIDVVYQPLCESSLSSLWTTIVVCFVGACLLPGFFDTHEPQKQRCYEYRIGIHSLQPAGHQNRRAQLTK